MGNTATPRQATESDAAAIRDLTHEAYAKWPAIIGSTPLPMQADYEAAVRAHRFDLLEIDGVLAALIETTPCSAHDLFRKPESTFRDHARDGDELMIVNVAVKPSMQKRGLGLRLLKHAEELAAAQGFRGTRLYTHQKMAANIALYRSVGYTIEREEEVPAGIRVHMVKARR